MNAINYLLQRYSDNRKSTLGLMFKRIVSGVTPLLHLCGYTLEDEFRESKVSKETRIPAGKYEIIVQINETPKTLQYRQKYPWFENHLMLKDVAGFIGIYIHIGNDDGDTDGCILMGDSADNNSIGPGAITNSTNCFRRFYKETYEHIKAGGKAFIEIRDEKALL